jgi:hypothetical protein
MSQDGETRSFRGGASNGNNESLNGRSELELPAGVTPSQHSLLTTKDSLIRETHSLLPQRNSLLFFVGNFVATD